MDVGLLILHLFLGDTLPVSTCIVLGAIATVYTEIIRDTPLLLQLYFFYFLLPDLLPALKLS